MKNSHIEWCSHTFNPFIGCSKVSPGCDHCYAETWAKRYGAVEWGPGKPRKLTSESNWKQPLKWNKEAAAAGVRARVFCASLADVFDNEVPGVWRFRLWTLIRDTPHLDWLLLTKRVGNIQKMLPPDWGSGYANVWLMISVVNQEEADRDIPKLLAIPARVRGLSMEPLLGPINLRQSLHSWRIATGDRFLKERAPSIHWVIAGGESGPGARPMHPAWAKSLRDQCVAAGIPYFFKQFGEYQYHPLDFHSFQHWVNKAQSWIGGWSPPAVCIDMKGRICRIGADMQRAHDENAFPVAIAQRVGKKAAGRLLDGRTWDEFPEAA